jgi:hypothetical protein
MSQRGLGPFNDEGVTGIGSSFAELRKRGNVTEEKTGGRAPRLPSLE